jgi:nitrogen PTS system EIIA component
VPYRTFSMQEVADYLHLDPDDVERLVKDQQIPFERHGSKVVFRKIEIDSWASPRILGLDSRKLADYHRRTSDDTRRFFRDAAILPQMIRPEYIDPCLPAKTKSSVLREMVRLAGKTERVWDSRGLLSGLQAREELCSTGLPGGLAILHTRQAEDYLFESLFLVLGRTVQDIPFGAPDGRPTSLFFLIACPDDRLHLHTLARLCMMAQKTELLPNLRAAADASAMYDCLINAENEVLA